MQFADHLFSDSGGVEVRCAVVVEIESGLDFLNECRTTSEIRGWFSYIFRRRLLKGLSDLKSHSNDPLSYELHSLRKL